MQTVTIANQKPILSTFRSPGGPKLGYGPDAKSDNRFNEMHIRRAAEIPGPGQYELKTDVNAQGTYFVDKYKNSQAPVFTKQSRLVTLDPSETRKITPGPGSYKMPTEFGYYEINNLGGTGSTLTVP
jgi:Sperm-tail PG-rich repeat